MRFFLIISFLFCMNIQASSPKSCKIASRYTPLQYSEFAAAIEERFERIEEVKFISIKKNVMENIGHFLLGDDLRDRREFIMYFTALVDGEPRKLKCDMGVSSNYEWLDLGGCKNSDFNFFKGSFSTSISFEEVGVEREYVILYIKN